MKVFPLTGPKIDVRQSSAENDDLLGNLILGPLKDLDITKKIFGGMDEDTMREKISTNGTPERKAFLKAIHESDEAITAIADAYKAEQGKADRKPHDAPAKFMELECMVMAQSHPDNIDRYRISDGRDADDVRTLRIMEKAAQRILGKEETPKMDFIVLAETEADIERLPETAKDILENGLNLDGKLTLFPGYSDAEKRMGITGLLTIAKSIGETLDNVDAFNKNNPSATDVDVTISHGGGEDITRNGNKTKHDATVQGRAGTQMGLVDYFKTALRVLTSGVDSMRKQADELLEIAKDPEAEAQLQNFLAKGRAPFRTMVSPNLETVQGTEKSEGLGLLTAELFGGDFYKATKLINKSSRSAAKAKKTPEQIAKADRKQRATAEKAAQERYGNDQASIDFEMKVYDELKSHNPYDLDKERAIGVASIFTASGTGSQVMMGMPTLAEVKELGVDKIKDSEVVKDMMYKTLYTAAITDFDRAYSLIGEDKAPRPSELPKEEHSAQSIKEQIASGNMQKAKIMQLENMQIHAVEATKAMAFMHGGDDAVGSLEASLNKGGTLAEATQEFLKGSGDSMLESLGISGEQMTNGSGKRITELLKQ